MPKVWIPKITGHDYSSAKKHGELTVMLQEDVSPFNIDLLTHHLAEVLKTVAKEDFYIPSGPTIINMVIMDMWPHPKMRVLMFHARTHEYIYREIIKCT